MKRNYSELPIFLSELSEELIPRPWTLRSLGEMLQLSYDMLDHPIFKSRSDYKDPFIKIMRDIPDYYRRYNRTIIERTIAQTQLYGDIEFDFGILTMTSQGIENILSTLKTITIVANQLNTASPEELRKIGPRLIRFQISEEAHVHSAINYFLHTCQVQILEIRTMRWKLELASLKQVADKREFLQRKKADLLHQVDSTDELIFTGLMKWLNIEIDFLNSVKEPDLGLAEIKPLIEKFLAQQQARVTNDALLRNLVRANLDIFCNDLVSLVRQVFSFHDISGKEPEKVYHAFLLGVLQGLSGQYKIQSNREAGLGRFDILLLPDLPYNDGIIFEVKRLDSNNPGAVENALNSALQQIEANEYFLELKLNGSNRYIGVAAGFYGKELFLSWRMNDIS